MSDFQPFPPFVQPPIFRPGVLIALGLLLIALGVIACIDATAATLASTVMIGVILLIAGVGQVTQTFLHPEWTGGSKWFAALAGLLYIVAGVLVIEEPVTGSVFITAFLAGCLIASGILRVIWVSSHRVVGSWWGLLLSAIITLLVGILIYVTLPWSGLWLLGTLIGVELIVSGIATVSFGIAAKRLL
jgi:uncharacterized membrane protein HdeD (DUF308 family)